MNRRQAIGSALALASAAWVSSPASAADGPYAPQVAVRRWYRLVLELVRHTATYSPPVASRAFAYMGVAVFEATASGNPALRTLAGQLNGLKAVPARVPDVLFDEGVILNAVLARSVVNFFGNTGPTGQRAVTRFTERMAAQMHLGVADDVVARSVAYGEAVAAHILAWSQDDGGAVVENMGFPLTYELKEGPAHWVPTSLVQQQQTPLLPGWGGNRSFAMPDGASCPLPPPPDYSEDPSSQFYREALEVHDVSRSLTDEQRAIARFWSDDPMLSPTPPGHWMSIALDQLDRVEAGLTDTADLLARLGVGLADAFIACWHSKYAFDLVRPLTYIRRVIDPKWEALLITPPFPEYPSGHSTQSGAAAEILTAHFGASHAFTDDTHGRDKLAARPFGSFWEAAEEAGISRLYGGIHFRAAIERGLDQGRCVATHTLALKTRTG